MNESTAVDEAARCVLCGRERTAVELVPVGVVRKGVRTLLQSELEQPLDDTDLVCQEDLNRLRARYVEDILERDRGELTRLERDVVESLERHELVSRDIEKEFERDRTLGERLADQVASFGGSWAFIGTFFGLLLLWIVLNSVQLVGAPFDPYPFILLNLVLSCLAAIQAPIIMMSQNRQEAKDRMRAQYDYRINLKAELEIRHLHSKVDQLLSHQWERLLEVQQMQMEVLQEIAGTRGG
ncbi:MAG: DUF1003 domain-containing protein [Acidobacteriota bacterium]